MKHGGRIFFCMIAFLLAWRFCGFFLYRFAIFGLKVLWRWRWRWVGDGWDSSGLRFAIFYFCTHTLTS